MNYGALNIRLEGKGFRPSVLKHQFNIPMKILAETGEIASIGRYKGQPSPYGMALIETESISGVSSLQDTVEEYTTLLWKHNQLLKESGVKQITFDIEQSNTQLNEISLTANVLQHLTDLEAVIEFHTIDDSKKVTTAFITEILKKNPSINAAYLQKLVALSNNYQSLNKTNALWYWLFLGMKDSSFEMEGQNHLNEFESFCESLTI